MAATTETHNLPRAASEFSSDPRVQRSEERAGPVLLLGGAAYAAAYIVVGLTRVSLWGALLAAAGTGLVLFGLRFIARQSV
jgi:hypothetical protein